jgi:predicted RNase H-like HicB family nuclease
VRVYTVLIERPQREGDSYGAYCPDLPGCIATGATEAEVLDLMVEAIELHLEGMAEDGDAIPENTVRAIEVAVREPHRRPAAA